MPPALANLREIKEKLAGTGQKDACVCKYRDLPAGSTAMPGAGTKSRKAHSI
jgi:hypothetical protein